MFGHTDSQVKHPRSAKEVFHMLAKPIGPVCNIDCAYCFYLDKTKLYPETKSFKMNEATLEQYVQQYIQGQPAGTPEVTFGWQGGEPTMMGIPFFENVLKYQKKHHRQGMAIKNALQTNGTLLNDNWGKFLHEHNFLLGISIDGPEAIHNIFRYDKKQRGTFKQVMQGIEICQKHEVEFNTLTVVQSHNGDYPILIYDFLKEIGSTFFQFIPIVEHSFQQESGKETDGMIFPNQENALQPGFAVHQRSVGSEQFGGFLNQIFDRWLEKNDIGEIFVRDFEMMLGLVMGFPSATCVNSETCGHAPAIEHNGDLYSCDHFVDSEYFLGNTSERSLAEMMDSPQQTKFGTDKRDSLPQFCLDCDFLKYCWGACPKDRIKFTPQKEKGLNYLCEGYQAFYSHTEPYFQKMAECLRMGYLAKDWKKLEKLKRAARKASPAQKQQVRVGRNVTCPCGSGKKYKKCCGYRGEGMAKP
ncbi:MAG: anaerobic sulfatase maturase [SAR324 cluster bacterium]|nr:anaerobic sulfatase maturase [SAR324 cluster bacterium]